mmetsp:Transcript_27958/g.63236  ORF Transcript_27958/g.63236 Transcript_27958/m.63236 type:complete len:94 (+) Transcript_27958:86-367(+)
MGGCAANVANVPKEPVLLSALRAVELSTEGARPFAEDAATLPAREQDRTLLLQLEALEEGAGRAGADAFLAGSRCAAFIIIFREPPWPGTWLS